MSRLPADPVVSVVIPSYNRAELLRRCLESMVAQTFSGFEVIVCDDGSTDHTAEVADAYRDRLRLTYHTAPNFGGPARPRNYGVSAASGTYIAFCDSDDWWYPNKLEVCVPLLATADVIYHDLDIRRNGDTAGKPIKTRAVVAPVFRDLVITGNWLPNSSVIVKKSLVIQAGGFSEDHDLIAVEDADLWVRISKLTDAFLYVRQRLGAYWVGENISLSALQVERENNLLNRHIHELSPADQAEARRRQHFRDARTYHSIGMLAEAKKNYLQALTARDMTVKIKALIGLSAALSGVKI